MGQKETTFSVRKRKDQTLKKQKGNREIVVDNLVGNYGMARQRGPQFQRTILMVSSGKKPTEEKDGSS